jgi:tetratricopeptide (TPR) repeat protein
MICSSNMICKLKPALLASALAAACVLTACGNPASPPEEAFIPGNADTVRLIVDAVAAVRSGDLARAGDMLNAALDAEPDNPAVWVAVARLRYRGGEHIEALEAADRALELSPQYGGALLLKAQLVRDAHGLAASIPWYEAASAAEPGNPEIWLDYAATLGDLGQNRAMLTALDELRQVAPQSPRANLLTAVLAARSGNMVLARSLLERSGAVDAGVPAAWMLDAIISLEQGNHTSAAERLEALLERQSDNIRARELLARAWLLAGREGEVIARFGGEGAAESVSPYLAMLVGRAHERMGERDKAALWLTRANAAPAPQPRVLLVSAGQPGPTAEVRSAARAGDWGRAATITADLQQRFAGSADVAALSGDVALGRGDVRGALKHYATASRVRRSWPLTKKAVAAYRMAGDDDAADVLIMRHLAGDPNNMDAALMLAQRSAAWGDWARAGRLLDHVRALGGANDLTYRTLRQQIAVNTGA